MKVNTNCFELIINKEIIENTFNSYIVKGVYTNESLKISEILNKTEAYVSKGKVDDDYVFLIVIEKFSSYQKGELTELLKESGYYNAQLIKKKIVDIPVDLLFRALCSRLGSRKLLIEDLTLLGKRDGKKFEASRILNFSPDGKEIILFPSSVHFTPSNLGDQKLDSYQGLKRIYKTNLKKGKYVQLRDINDKAELAFFSTEDFFSNKQYSRSGLVYLVYEKFNKIFDELFKLEIVSLDPVDKIRSKSDFFHYKEFSSAIKDVAEQIKSVSIENTTGIKKYEEKLKNKLSEYIPSITFSEKGDVTLRIVERKEKEDLYKADLDLQHILIESLNGRIERSFIYTTLKEALLKKYLNQRIIPPFMEKNFKNLSGWKFTLVQSLGRDKKRHELKKYKIDYPQDYYVLTNIIIEGKKIKVPKKSKIIFKNLKNAELGYKPAYNEDIEMILESPEYGRILCIRTNMIVMPNLAESQIERENYKKAEEALKSYFDSYEKWLKFEKDNFVFKNEYGEIIDDVLFYDVPKLSELRERLKRKGSIELKDNKTRSYVITDSGNYVEETRIRQKIDKLLKEITGYSTVKESYSGILDAKRFFSGFYDSYLYFRDGFWYTTSGTAYDITNKDNTILKAVHFYKYVFLDEFDHNLQREAMDKIFNNIDCLYVRNVALPVHGSAMKILREIERVTPIDMSDFLLKDDDNLDI